MDKKSSGSTTALQKLYLVLRYLVIVIVLGVLGYAVIHQWVIIRDTLVNVRWEYVLVGSLIELLVWPWMGVIAWFILKDLGSNPGLLKVMGCYFVSQAAKYLPGGIWAFPGRALLYQSLGVDKVASTISVLREVVALFLGAAIVGLVGIIQGLPISSSIAIAIALGTTVSLAAVFLTQVPWFMRLLARFKFFRSSPLVMQSLESSQLSLRWLPGALLSSLVYWFGTGLAFRFIAVAITKNAASLSWFQLSGIFSLSWAVGFVFVFVPAGIGIRESAISLLLASVTDAGGALSIALLSRLWWMLTESIYSVIFTAWFSSQNIWRRKKA